MTTPVLLTLIGFGITIVIFLIKMRDNNRKFEKSQAKEASGTGGAAILLYLDYMDIYLGNLTR